MITAAEFARIAVHMPAPPAPCPVMPPAERVGLPDDVAALLAETHAWHVRMVRHHAEFIAEHPEFNVCTTRLMEQDVRQARRIRTALRTAGCFEAADVLAAAAHGLALIEGAVS